MDKSELKKQLKLQWIKNNIVLLLLITISTIGLFVLAIVFHKFMLVIAGILLGFISLFYGRNKMMIYIEKNI